MPAMHHLWWSVLTCVLTAALPNSAFLPPQIRLAIDHHQSPTALRHVRRDGTPALAGVDVKSALLVADVQMGNPRQALRLRVVIGTGDTQVIAENAVQCQAANNTCPFERYDPSKSSSYSPQAQTFSLNYVDGTGVQGQFFADDTELDGTLVKDFEMALITNGTSDTHILGLGPSALEKYPNSYDNFPYRLCSNGTTNIVGFSMWFDSKDYLTTGKLTFGGVDTKKFNGTLETLPIVATQSSLHFVAIRVSGIAITADGTVSSLNDSFADYTIGPDSYTNYLPVGVVQQLRSQLGFEYVGWTGSYVQAYSEMKNDTSIGFTFGTTTIEMSVGDLAIPFNASHAIIAIRDATDSSQNIIGLSLFRNGYWVIDYTHNQISVAKLVYNTASNLTFIGANGTYGLSSSTESDQAPISGPSATGASASTTANTSTPTASTATGLPPVQNQDSSSTKIGIGVGVGLGVPLLMAIAFIIFRTSRRRRHSQARVDTMNSTLSSDRDKKDPGAAELANAQNGLYEEKYGLKTDNAGREFGIVSESPLVELADSSSHVPK